MSQWPTVPLGEVITHRKEFIQINELETYKRCRVQLHAQGVVLRDQVAGTEIKTKKQQVCRAEEFLVAEIDAKLGGYGIVPPDLEGAIVSSHYFLFGINEDKIDRRFLGYYVRTPAFHKQVAAQGSTNYAAIRPSHVLSYSIPLPTLTEQRRLVERIDALATKIEEAKGLRCKASHATGWLVETALDSIFEKAAANQRWPRVPLRDAATINRGKFAHRPRNEPRFYGGDIPFIQIGEISASRQYIRQFSQTLNEQGLHISRKFPKGTVVIAITGATIGVTGILDFDSCFPDSIVGIQPKQGVSTSEYIYWAVEYEKHKALSQATQTTQPNINLQKLDSLTIPLPTEVDQRKFVEHIGTIRSKSDALKDHQREIQTELNAMLPAILDRAFRGEL
ncbi:MAG: restriction endonuclease subunit S [Planctomycetia bacterium]|nr:restriction endonuclease subunit S [Planctomycetia bacterium]